MRVRVCARCAERRGGSLTPLATLLLTETKNQWARDDPAFVVVTCALVAAAACAYCAAYAAHRATVAWTWPERDAHKRTPLCVPSRFAESFAHSLLTVVSAVLVDYLLLGVVLATSGWCVSRRAREAARSCQLLVLTQRPCLVLRRLLSNRYLRTMATLSHSVEQRVEWFVATQLLASRRVAYLLTECEWLPVLFAGCMRLMCIATRTSRFSLRCTVRHAAPIPSCHIGVWHSLTLLGLRRRVPFTPPTVVQYFLSPLLLAPGFISVVLSNTLYGAALSYYHYTQFLGYNGACLWCACCVLAVPHWAGAST